MTSYNVDEVNAGARTLNDLLSVICEVQFELDPSKKDDRIDSLLWIARDLSEGVVRCIDDGYAEKRGRTAA
jgi:hypothetical protein